MTTERRVDPLLDYAGALLLLAVWSPAFVTDFGVHNDYLMGANAGDPRLTFAHVESYQLVRVGRFLNALLFNAHWKWIDALGDLKFSRLASASLLAAAFLITTRQLAGATRLSKGCARVLSLAIFLTPAVLVDAFYATLLVPGSLVVLAMTSLFAAQRRLLPDENRAVGATRLLAWLTLNVVVLVAGHFVYTPSTLFFLALAATHLVYGNSPARDRRRATAELGVYALASLVYLPLAAFLVTPWALRSFAFSQVWFDRQYALSWALTGRSLVFQTRALHASLNVWNAFEGLDVKWGVLSLLGVAALHRLWRLRRERDRIPHLSFVAGFVGMSFAAGFLPFLFTTIEWPGYRMLLGPASLLAVLVVRSVQELVDVRVRALPARFAAAGRFAAALCLGGIAVSTIAAGVTEARGDIRCLEHALQAFGDEEAILLLEGPLVASPLRFEFSLTPSQAGHLTAFGQTIARDLVRRGEISVADGRRMLAITRGVSFEEAWRLRASAPRTALLSVSGRACGCVVGWGCAGFGVPVGVDLRPQTPAGVGSR